MGAVAKKVEVLVKNCINENDRECVVGGGVEVIRKCHWEFIGSVW